MQQLLGLWRDTKYIWLLFVVVIAGMSYFASPYYVFVTLALPISFCYFAFIRYDEHGKEKPDYQ